MNNKFEKLVKRLSPTIRGISHRMNGHFTFFNDDDLCQEALIHLWVMSGKGALDDKTDSYILQGCYFHLKNYIRTSVDKATLISMEKPVDEEGAMLKDMIVSQERPALNDVEERVLLKSMYQNGLSKREKEVLRLSLRGLTTREIGIKLEISHVAIVKIRKKIRCKCAILEKELKE